MKKYIKKILVWLNWALAIALAGAFISTRINPEFIWQMAFLGLAFPILVILNIVFLGFWTVKRKAFLLISLFALLINGKNIGRYFQLTGATGVRDESAISVLSFNVRLFNYYKWEQGNVRNDILRLVKTNSPDIVCFQEILTVETDQEQSEQFIDQTLNLPQKHIAYTHKPGPDSNYGIATYSKFPIVKKSTIRFKNSFNVCIFTDIKIEEDTVRVFNLHLQSIKFDKENYEAIDGFAKKSGSGRINGARSISNRLKLAYIKRAQQVDEINWHIKHSPFPVIICGDFNDTPVSYTYRRVLGDLEDAFTHSGRGMGQTYRGKLPFLRIDFIFHSPVFESMNYKVHKASLSDHYPVSVELVKIP